MAGSGSCAKCSRSTFTRAPTASISRGSPCTSSPTRSCCATRPAGLPCRSFEQNYRADTISQGLLLALNEGKSLDFLTRDNLGHETIVHGKVVRSGYVPHFQGGAQFGQAYFQAQMAEAGNRQPIIEVNGQLRFSLPGEPIFPALGDDAILQPLLTWDIAAGAAGHLDAELSYVTGGMRWKRPTT